ncbi:hypothetical protein P9112_005338 [Eukaryota sp. TZLM1-RC]
MESTVKVFLRVRPPRSQLAAFENCIPSSTLDDTAIEFFNSEGQVDPDSNQYPHTVIIKNSSKILHQTSLDGIFLPSATQADVYTPVESLVDLVFTGINATVFAYGLTGSGKTHTILSGGALTDPDLKGILPRAAEQIFSTIDSNPSSNTTVSVSLLQIYKESLQDLLHDGEPLAIREDVVKGIFVQNLSTHLVDSSSSLISLLSSGLSNRSTATTRMNKTSSRSHVLAIINIIQKISSSTGVFTLSSRLNVADLAGSERVSRTECEGARLEEAKKINLSLSTLGNVIRAIVDQTPHIPYRESKLTMTLRDSLGGNSNCLVYCNVSLDREDLQETVSTLQFASRVSRVSNFVRVNKVDSIDDLNKQIVLLKNEVEEKALEVSLLREFLTVINPAWESLFDQFLTGSEIPVNHPQSTSDSPCSNCKEVLDRLHLEKSQHSELLSALMKTLQTKTKKVTELEDKLSNSNTNQPSVNPQAVTVSSVQLSEPIASQSMFSRKRRSLVSNWFTKKKKVELTHQKIEIQGWLFKKTSKCKWKERWFVLDSASRLLSYYHNEKDSVPQNSIPITPDVRIVNVMDEGRSNCFELFSSVDTSLPRVVLSASTPALLQKWMGCIQNVAFSHNQELVAASPNQIDNQMTSDDVSFVDKSGWVFILSSDGIWNKRFITLNNQTLIISHSNSTCLSPETTTFPLFGCSAQAEGCSEGLFTWIVNGSECVLRFCCEGEGKRDDWVSAFNELSR